MDITAEDKQRFLELIREGLDRPTAAMKVREDLTGTMFRRLCTPGNYHYDADFASQYDDALAYREEHVVRDPLRPRVEGSERASSATTPAGFTRSHHLTPEQLEDFLERVRNGTQAATAAREIEPPTSITQIHRRAARDLDFADRFRQAKEDGLDAYKENLRAEAARQAFAGDYRALRDQMIIHLDEARLALTTNRHEVGGFDGDAIRLLAERHFAELPPEMLDELIATLERRELGIGAGELDAGEQ